MSSQYTSKYRPCSIHLEGEHRHEKWAKIVEKAKWCIGQHETSAHGMFHIQGVFGFLNPQSLAAVQREFGATVENTKDPHALIKYVTDEGKRDPETDILVNEDIPKFSRKISSQLIEYALMEPNFETAMKFVEQQHKLYYISNSKKLSFYFQQKFDVSDHALYPPERFNIALTPLHHATCLVFIGATGTGKTQ